MNKPPLLQSAHILMVEDNPGFASLVNLLLQEIGVANIHIATSYKKGLDLYKSQQPDICILDIDLGKDQPSGIQLAEEIRKQNPLTPIIFLTSNYTDDHYEKVRYVRPSSFLSKELSKLKLYQAIDLALMQVKDAEHFGKPSLPSAPHNITYINGGPTEHLFFKVGDSFKRIHVDEVSFFYSKDKLTYARVGNRNLPTSVQLKVLEDELNAHFVRIHKSYLVNIQCIDIIHPGESNLQIGEEVLPVGYVYRKPFLERLKLLK